MSRKTRNWLAGLLGLGVVSAIIVGGWLLRPAGSADGVTAIRIGAPVVSGSQQIYANAIGIARYKGMLDREFARDGIKIEYIGFSNAAMVAQALANAQIDFAFQGDMISIISKAGGNDTRLIMPSGRYANAYLAVPVNSPIQSVEDLRGKRVAYTKGNYVQLQALRILAAYGMTEQDIRVINLSAPAGAAALAAGQVDAVFQGTDILLLREKGIVRIVYDTRNHPEHTAQTGLLVRSAFAKERGNIVFRVVRVIVEASRYGSDEAHREEALRIWATGRKISPLREDYAGRPMRVHLNPLFDPFILSRYEITQRETEKLGLLRSAPISIRDWFDTQYLDRALKQLQLQDFWTPIGTDGKPLKDAA